MVSFLTVDVKLFIFKDGDVVNSQKFEYLYNFYEILFS